MGGRTHRGVSGRVAHRADEQPHDAFQHGEVQFLLVCRRGFPRPGRDLRQRLVVGQFPLVRPQRNGRVECVLEPPLAEFPQPLVLRPVRHHESAPVKVCPADGLHGRLSPP